MSFCEGIFRVVSAGRGCEVFYFFIKLHAVEAVEGVADVGACAALMRRIWFYGLLHDSSFWEEFFGGGVEVLSEDGLRKFVGLAFSGKPSSDCYFAFLCHFCYFTYESSCGRQRTGLILCVLIAV